MHTEIYTENLPKSRQNTIQESTTKPRQQNHRVTHHDAPPLNPTTHRLQNQKHR